MPDIISIGECMIELFSDKPMEEADVFHRSFAGDSLNILVAATRLGTSTGYITRVGSDPFTRYLLNAWQKEGIDTSHAREVKGFNAVHFVALLPGGDREFVYYRKGSAPSTMEPSDLDPEYISSAGVMHISGITQAISESARATALRAAQIAKERGVKVSYDPNYRHQLWTRQEARKALEALLPYVNYFFPSVPADSEAYLGTSDPNETIEMARSMNPDLEVVAAKCGPGGAVVSAGGEVIAMPPHTPGPVVDTTGAGDAFNGGFLHGILSGMGYRDAALIGSIAAGLKLRGRGALTAMPRRDEVYEMFEALRDKSISH